MGVVYRARDREPGREVALKLLPPELTSDPERSARLEREARTLAAVQHSGIATLYELGQAEENGRTIRFLAMELIEGEDLQARLQRQGALEVPEALDLGRQIAAALEVAHEAGVIYRDLKPANVRVTPQDRAVVVDFGLAKPTGGSSGAASESLALSASPTMAAPTVAGTILGTAPYMSPEQARGKPLDRRPAGCRAPSSACRPNSRRRSPFRRSQTISASTPSGCRRALGDSTGDRLGVTCSSSGWTMR
jgi:serine/threonine-protein kinase